MQKKWKEAEDILLEILSIEKDNYRALTEMALIYKHWGKEIPREDNLKRELKQKYLDAVIKSYKANSENISILMEFADIFKNQRQYRAALAFLEIIQGLRPDDLESIRVQETFYGYINDEENVLKCREKGNKLIEQNPLVKYREKFDKQNIQVKAEIKLVSQTEKGKYKYIFSTRKSFIESIAGTKFSILPGGNQCRSLRNGDEAFYGLYIKDRKEFVDCIEPYFQSINDLLINGKGLLS